MRIFGALLLVGVAATHILEAREEEAKYIVVLFAALAVAALILAALFALGRLTQPVIAAAAGLCGTAIVGYVLSRTVGLPQMADDVGNWTEPFGIAALACEVAFIACAASA